MSKTVVAVFDRMLMAEDAIGRLQDAGVGRNDISIVTTGDKSASPDDDEVHGSLAGAGAGAAIGGVAGLIVGLAALAIPGFGPVLAAGPLAAALGSAGVGAVAGGLVGGLTGMDIPEDDAHYYAEAVRRGGAVVVVKTSDVLADTVRDLLDESGALNVEEKIAEWRSQGWKGYDASTRSELERSSEPNAPQITESAARIYVGGLEMDPRKSTFQDFNRK